MTNIECRANDCKYNDNNKCCCQEINVKTSNGCVICNNFEIGAKSFDTEFGVFGKINNSKISCEAGSCVNNTNNCCNKETILVSGKKARNKNQTGCQSFKPF